MLGHFIAYFGQFFIYSISFLSHRFRRCCFVQSQFMHIFYLTFYALFMCSYYLNGSVPFIVLAIILLTYLWELFLSSNFIVFLALFYDRFARKILLWEWRLANEIRIYRFYDKKSSYLSSTFS